MTFASKLKNELLRIVPDKAHCVRAECAGMLLTLGLIKKKENHGDILYVLTESAKFVAKYFTLLKKAFNIESNVSMIQTSSISDKTALEIDLDKAEASVLQAMGWKKEGFGFDFQALENTVLYKKCCKRAFLRAVFTAGGSVSDPEKAYHFEISFSGEEQAALVQRLIRSFGPDAKIMKRKSNYVVYLQNKESILDMLSIMESSRYLMEMENLCIVKEVRNNANRQTNCDNANIKRMVGAAMKQVDDISYIVETHGIEILPENLREIAIIRLENKDESLTALGELLDPPLGKSGVNHRLRKLSEFADRLRKDGYKEK